MSLTNEDPEARPDVVILYGGNSPEHDVSRTSALHVDQLLTSEGTKLIW